MSLGSFLLIHNHMKKALVSVVIFFGIFAAGMTFLAIKSQEAPAFHVPSTTTLPEAQLLTFQAAHASQPGILSIIDLPSQNSTTLPTPKEFGQFSTACIQNARIFARFEHTIAEWTDGAWKPLVTKPDHYIVSAKCNRDADSFDLVLAKNLYDSNPNSAKEILSVPLLSGAKTSSEVQNSNGHAHILSENMFTTSGIAFAYHSDASLLIRDDFGRYDIFFENGQKKQSLISGWRLFDAPIEFAQWVESDRFTILSLKQNLYLYNPGNNTYAPLNFRADQVYEVK